jgi:ketosteroid isomerase-like protein
MSTAQIVRDYFAALGGRQGWESFLAEDLAFTSHAGPGRRVSGKEPYLASKRRFFSMISSLEVRNVIVEGTQACALTRYELRSPAGPAFHSDVAEVFTVRDGKIASLDIYFDSAPFPK